MKVDEKDFEYSELKRNIKDIEQLNKLYHTSFYIDRHCNSGSLSIKNYLGDTVGLHVYTINDLERVILTIYDTLKSMYDVSEEFIVIPWPEVQELMNKEGFRENSCLVNDSPLYEEFGDQAYFVRKQWINSIS